MAGCERFFKPVIISELICRITKFFFINSDSNNKAIENIVQDQGLQDSLRIQGYQRLEHFSWQKTAELTKRLYEDIINETPNN
jgi:glycosyltransferase involved in cell wall biosynthesis